MKSLLRYRKPIALFYLLVFSFSAFYPGVSWALTSGPSQPEMQGFQASSTSDMVDLFTGDFSYSVPLMDVGGYPLQLSYRSGASIDDEASWVGYGWSLTPGVINRQMRGLPDDFKGDAIVKESYAKPNITKSLTASATLKLKGNNLIKPSVRVGIRFNNYTGIAASFGANANLNMGDDASGKLTASLGISGDNQSGSLFNGTVNYPIIYEQKDNADKLKGALDFAFSRNAGLQQLTLGLTYNHQPNKERPEKNDTYSRSISFLNDLGFPQVRPFLKSSSFSFKVSLGAKIFPLFLSPLGLTGSYSISETPINKITVATPAYGMLYIAESVKKPEALKDFNRENDIPFSKKLPNLSLPIHTPDLFNISSSASSGQFKIITSGTGIFADNYQTETGSTFSTGIELGFGTGSHVGFNIPPNFSFTTNSSGKWINKNNFLSLGDFKDNSLSSPQLQPSIFKKVGEGTINDEAFYSLIGEQQVVRVPLDKSLASYVFGGSSTKKSLINLQNNLVSNTSLQRSTVEKRGSLFNYLTAKEASMFGLNKKILSFPINKMVTCQNQSSLISSIDRFSSSSSGQNTYTVALNAGGSNINPFNQSPAKAHHLSEITVTEMGGGRQVFGLPVYNLVQENVSFSVPDRPEYQKTGFYHYQIGESQVATSKNDSRVKSKLYNYHYNRQIVPAYATSYLLSAVLSPDYVDKTNDGVSDDDLGTAVKFNYSKLPYSYRWRTPFAPPAPGQTQDRIANYSEGLLADKKDARATFSYGEREVWYNHSIESKTMVAFFILNDNDTAKRKDGYGVLGRDGGIDWSRSLRYLKEIRLYSKAEIASKGMANAVPIKVAHFEYNYEMFAGSQTLPNSIEGGKLTLKKIWFSFGRSYKGRLSPFEFSYQLPASNPDKQVGYLLREYDRWGNYKSFKTNPLQLPNSEYPYSIQDKSVADENASLWNLVVIKTPTGGKLSIQYESDDYAYVQDKRATVMAPISGMGSFDNFSQFSNRNEIFVQLENPNHLSLPELKYQYFSGLEYLYFRCYTELNSSGVKDYVQGYGKILDVQTINDTTAKVTLEKINNYNPVSMAGWQLLKSSLPQIAYPGYDNLDSEESDFKKVASALISAFARLPELVRSFESIAASRKYCDSIQKGRSWVRINSPGFRKMGGGNRVASLKISDDWKNMTGNSDAPSGEYGQKYYYNTTQTISPTGRTIAISSGVASYEPMIGNEENPFRLPVFFSNKNFLGPSQTSFIERPLGESFFQSPVVGYSKVRVVSVGANPSSEGKTGATETEFFTAKDFPVIVDESPMEKIQPAANIFSRFFSFVITNHITCSQGYLVINNNMHGKLKSEKVTDKNGQQISASFYDYQVKDNNSAIRLDNAVPVLNKSGNVSSRIAGVDVDVYHDMRETSTETIGASGEPSLGLGFPGTGSNYFNWGFYLPNYEKRLFRSTVSVKSVYQFGILKKVTKIINGSRNESENVLWDAETGEVLMTKTQNEYDKPLYSFNYPAHWMYPGMQGSYFNQGIYLSGLSIDASGVITNHQSVLSPGDELINLNSGLKYWVTDINSNSTSYQLIDVNGNKVVNSLSSSLLKILRSGKRNMSNASTGMIVSLDNPIQNNKLQISDAIKILDAKSVEYSEDWWKPLPFQPVIKAANFVESFSMQEVSIKANYFGAINLKLNKPVTVPTRISFSYKLGTVVSYGFIDLSVGQSEVMSQIATGIITPGSLSNATIVTDLNALWPKTFVCQSPVDSLFNPYVTGILGDWKPKTSYVYDVKRSVAGSGVTSDNISKSGYYLNFGPFWSNNGTAWYRNNGANANQWRWTQQVSLIGTKGQEIENKDALGQYHSAQFGYMESLPVAVASNARHREIFFESFEDIDFSLGCKSSCDICNTSNSPLFSFRKYSTDNAYEKKDGHTGNTSYRLTSALQLTTETMLSEPTSIYSRTTAGEFKLTSNYLLKGFLPIPGKKYILSCWIKDNQKNNKAQINLYVNGELKTKPDNQWPLVEGWKRVEVEFNINQAQELSVLFEPLSSSILMDDIRIYPFDGQMKSYVYNSSNLRLVADLDENNFATFYDYDNEGIPIRVRKETERGIMTLKETRSANAARIGDLSPNSFKFESGNLVDTTKSTNLECNIYPIWVNDGNAICTLPDNLHNDGTQLQKQIDINPYTNLGSRFIALPVNLSACPITPDWRNDGVPQCTKPDNIHNNGHQWQQQTDKNPFSNNGTRIVDLGINISACPLVADWVNDGAATCSKPDTIHNDGTQLQRQVDQNPYTNYGTRNISLPKNITACPIIPDWRNDGNTQCVLSGSYRTGELLYRQTDYNPYTGNTGVYQWVSAGINTEACPVPQDWQDVSTAIYGQPSQKCDLGAGGYNTGKVFQLQQNRNPFSLDPMGTRYRDAGVNLSACPVNEDWQNDGVPQCTKPDNIHNNGRQWQQQTDKNPYTNKGTRIVDVGINASACPIVADWVVTGLQSCQVSGGYNTGHLLSELRDQNPYSSTYGQTNWVVAGVNTSVCPITQDWKDVSVAISGQPAQKCAVGTGGYNTGTLFQLQQNMNPFSSDPMGTRYRDAGVSLSACPVNEDWQNDGVPQCTKPNNIHNNGRQWQQQTDKNPYTNKGTRIVDVGINTSACPIVADWVATSSQSCQVSGGYTTGHLLQQYRDQNPYSSTYGQTNWVDAGVNTSVCPVSPPDWRDASTSIYGQPVQKCETGTGGYNTGRLLQLQINLNPYSNSYNATQYRDAGISAACPINADWQIVNSYCDQSSGFTNGYKILVEKDMNPYSSSSNSQRTRTIYDPTNCPDASPNWQFSYDYCQMDGNGFYNFYHVYVYVDVNPNSVTYNNQTTTIWYEPYACPSPPSYQYVSSYCETDVDGINTGFKINIYQDMNPYSTSYGSRYNNYVYDPVNCPNNSPNYQPVNSYCETTVSGNTGFYITVYMDINGSSSTYGETYTNSVYNPGMCPPPCIYTCYGEGYKCVNNFCEYGVKKSFGSVYQWGYDPTYGYGEYWFCIFRYEWSDGSQGPDILISSGYNGSFCFSEI